MVNAEKGMIQIFAWNMRKRENLWPEFELSKSQITTVLYLLSKLEDTSLAVTALECTWDYDRK
jgi:hypothetical protein